VPVSKITFFLRRNTLFIIRSSAITEIAPVGGDYAIQGHSRSSISISVEARMRLPISE